MMFHGAIPMLMKYHREMLKVDTRTMNAMITTFASECKFESIKKFDLEQLINS